MTYQRKTWIALFLVIFVCTFFMGCSSQMIEQQAIKSNQEKQVQEPFVPVVAPPPPKTVTPPSMNTTQDSTEKTRQEELDESFDKLYDIK
jgi:hypothetical protein